MLFEKQLLQTKKNFFFQEPDNRSCGVEDVFTVYTHQLAYFNITHCVHAVFFSSFWFGL